MLCKSKVVALLLLVVARWISSTLCQSCEPDALKLCDTKYSCDKQAKGRKICFECLQDSGTVKRIDVINNDRCDKLECCLCKGAFRFCHLGSCDKNLPCLFEPRHEDEDVDKGAILEGLIGLVLEPLNWRSNVTLVNANSTSAAPPTQQVEQEIPDGAKLP